VDWIIEIATACWPEFVDWASKGRPWWVWTLWALSPLFVLAAFFGIGGLLLP
jgi:hypothetical protein